MNLCVFSGRLTRDARVSQTKAGKSVATYSLAVPCGWGDKKKTVFIDCVHWNVESLSKYLTKGKPVTIRGQYNVSEYTGEDNEAKRRVEIIVAELEFQVGEEKKEQQQKEDKLIADEEDYGIPF